jgi:hypothetical protein
MLCVDTAVAVGCVLSRKVKLSPLIWPHREPFVVHQQCEQRG